MLTSFINIYQDFFVLITIAAGGGVKYDYYLMQIESH